MARYSRNRILGGMRACHAARSNSARGTALEDLCLYLFARVPGVRFHDRDVANASRSQEVDLIFWVDHVSPLRFMPWVLLVETKNHASRLSAQEVGWFVDKLRRRKLAHGILVALHGVTGTMRPPTAAWDVVRSAVQEGIRVLVLTVEDMEALQTTEDLVHCLQDRILEITMLA